MKPITKYEAFDGSIHETEEACTAYEKVHRPIWWALIDLDADTVKAMWEDPIDNELAQQVISLGYGLAATRRNLERARTVEREAARAARPDADQELAELAAQREPPAPDAAAAAE